MSEQQRIRDELADEIAGVVTGEGFYSMTIGINAAQEAADLILASPVIRRIQADALDDFRETLIASQLEEFGIVLPDVDGIINDLDMQVIRYREGADDV